MEKFSQKQKFQELTYLSQGLSCFLDISLLHLSLDHEGLVKGLVEGRVEITFLQFSWRRQSGVLDGGASRCDLSHQVDFGSSRFPRDDMFYRPICAGERGE